MSLWFGDVVYNTTGIYVAALNADNSYGTPAYIEYGQKINWEYVHDQDEIKSYGMFVEALSINTKAKGKLGDAAMNWDAIQAFTGVAHSSSNVTPNRVDTLDVTVGGSGLGYFGLIASFASPNGANFLGGFPKCMLGAWPSFDMDQNKFRTSEVDISMYAPSTIIRKLARLRRYETAAALPSTSGAFATFFSGMF